MKNDFRDVYQRALSHLHSAFAKEMDFYNAAIKSFSTFEIRYLDDIATARELWKQAAQVKGNGSNVSLWAAYLEFEKSFGDSQNLHKVCTMCVNSISEPDQAESVFQLCISSLLEMAVNPRVLTEFQNRIRVRRQHLSALAIPTDSDKAKKRPQEAATTKPPSKKLKTEPTAKKVGEQQITTAKTSLDHGEYVAHDPTKNSFTAFVSNLDFSITENQLEHRFQKIGPLNSIRMVRDYKGRSKGFAYVEFQKEEDCKTALQSLDRVPVEEFDTHLPSSAKVLALHQRPMFVSECNPNKARDGSKSFKFAAAGVERNKLFVKGLDKKVSESQVEAYFALFGNLRSVRLVTFRNGISKGIAYVEFEDANSASKALVATDGKEFEGKQLQVALSNPPQKTAAQVVAAPSNNKRPENRSARNQLGFLPRVLNRNGPTAHLDNDAENKTEKSNADFRKMFLN
ncbi:Squamous cell carcinoma antigen recognized by T-cells 3 [Cichlidogyrus casuarinus]|uniref:Squamous cell carcinoma antigen recognized by T-cells 3 n=1 Tax=Cichlidogyrus casuarinus TaxID=1844966 RepID=A0ABD2QE61_9PLAT